MHQCQQAVESFRDLAASYCELVEGVSSFEPDEVLERLAVLLPSLMAAAVQLPRLEPDPDLDAPAISHEAWSERFDAINARLGAVGDYWTTMHVRAGSTPEVVNLPLADDLADIWQDLRGGLDLLASGGGTADVVWEWRFGFETHWGAHAAEALRAVHAALHL